MDCAGIVALLDAPRCEELYAAVARVEAFDAIPIEHIEHNQSGSSGSDGALDWLNDPWLLDLAALAVLDRMTRIHLPGLHIADPAAHAASDAASSGPSFAVALIGSIYSRINAAYVYPELAPSHETLSVAAWLGVLLAGRAALMPPFIARWLLEDGARGPSVTIKTTADAIIDRHVMLLGGHDRLEKIARRVERVGVPAVVAAPANRWPNRWPNRWLASASGAHSDDMTTTAGGQHAR